MLLRLSASSPYSPPSLLPACVQQHRRCDCETVSPSRHLVSPFGFFMFLASRYAALTGAAAAAAPPNSACRRDLCAPGLQLQERTNVSPSSTWSCCPPHWFWFCTFQTLKILAWHAPSKPPENARVAKSPARLWLPRLPVKAAPLLQASRSLTATAQVPWFSVAFADSTQLLLTELPFQRLVREIIAQEGMSVLPFTTLSLLAIQGTAESNIIHMLLRTQICVPFTPSASP